ncbi:unnamed protein product [Effrenium voratum]|nr:unnamed protein product [Effrenium voratum]
MATSPYHVEDLESRSTEGHSESMEEEEIKATNSGYLHPDDSMHQYWYETTCRLRCIFFVFFSLAVMLACALGSTTECFFSLMATPPSEGITFGVVVGVVIVPLILLATAVYVDEAVDVGLDAADRPCFGLFRATVTTALKSISPRIGTDHIEKMLVVMIEGIPILFAIITLACTESLTYWYKDLFRGYCLGGLIFAIVACIMYITCHIFVGHNPERDDAMACTYHNMRPLGKFKRVLDEPDRSLENREPHWGRCLMYFSIGLFIEILVLVVFIFAHHFHTVFIGQLLATICWALAVRQYAPRLLGKAFWCTFLFFILLTVGLLLGTLAQTDRRDPKSLPPLAYGSTSQEYGAEEDFNGLPLHFQLGPFPPKPGYPVCNADWGYPGMRQDDRMSILDLSLLAYGSSLAGPADIRSGLGQMLNGTRLENWELLEVEDQDTVGRWIVVRFPELKLRVVAVRGTSSVQDAYADLKLYSAVAVLQMMSIMTPVLTLMPVSVVQRLVDSQVSTFLFGSSEIWQRLEQSALKHKEEGKANNEVLLMTGHSLGGALVGAVSSRIAVEGIGFSPPGLYYQVEKYKLQLRKVYDSFTVIQPSNDVVPRVDQQRGMIMWIECVEPASTCHRLTHTACELWTQCGDKRKRDWRPLCSEWYSASKVNMVSAASAEL